MGRGCHHCQKLKQLYPIREYNPKSHTKNNCPILAETKCYNCGEIGHTPKYCKKPKIKCTSCGRIGHTVDMCMTISNNSNSEEKNFKNLDTNSWIILNQKSMDFENI
jgi:hypothetical protein